MDGKIKTTPTIDIEDLSLEELIELRDYINGEITERSTTKKENKNERND
jgi:hypothetical protein